MTRLVVAGGTGYAGGHVIAAAHRAGYQVRALARAVEKLGDLRPSCDEVFRGEATRPETLKGLCQDAEVLFSSIGVRSFRARPSIWEVDLRANLNLLDLARSSGVRHVIFISAVLADELRMQLPVAEARERVVDALQKSGLRYTVIRPTGLFNDMRELFDMAAKGTYWVVGDGHTRINPIHGADLADLCVSAIADTALWNTARSAGGPEVHSYLDIGRAAFGTLGRAPRIRTIPAAALGLAAAATRPFNANLSGFLKAMQIAGSRDLVGRAYGNRTVGQLFEELARKATNS